MHLDFGQWILLGFGDETGGSHRTLFVVPKDSDLYEKSRGGEGFAGNPEVTLGSLPSADVQADEAHVAAEIQRAIDDSRGELEKWASTPYRKHNRAPLFEAVYDEDARRQLLVEGLKSVPEGEDDVAATDVYSHISDQGYHFPDWLVTDYVLSLATKPLVILSGISGTGKTKMAQLVAEYVRTGHDGPRSAWRA